MQENLRFLLRSVCGGGVYHPDKLLGTKKRERLMQIIRKIIRICVCAMGLPCAHGSCLNAQMEIWKTVPKREYIGTGEPW